MLGLLLLLVLLLPLLLLSLLGSSLPHCGCRACAMWSAAVLKPRALLLSPLGWLCAELCGLTGCSSSSVKAGRPRLSCTANSEVLLPGLPATCRSSK